MRPRPHPPDALPKRGEGRNAARRHNRAPRIGDTRTEKLPRPPDGSILGGYDFPPDEVALMQGIPPPAARRIALVLLLTAGVSRAADPPDFETQVAPLLRARCLGCHAGPRPK